MKTFIVILLMGLASVQANACEGLKGERLKNEILSQIRFFAASSVFPNAKGVEYVKKSIRFSEIYTVDGNYVVPVMMEVTAPEEKPVGFVAETKTLFGSYILNARCGLKAQTLSFLDESELL